MSVLLLAVAVLVAVLYAGSVVRVLRAALRTARMFWMARTIPGPPNGVLYFAGPMDEILDKAIAAKNKYGNIVRVWAWPAVNITLAEPEDLEVGIWDMGKATESTGV